MKVTRLPLEGCFQIVPELRQDNRGAFARVFCEDTFASHGLVTHWSQCNMSVTKSSGTLRGMHLQYGTAAEVKLIRCVRGSAFDVLVDLREGSPTFGQWCGVEISQENSIMIYVAAGCAHGFQSLKPDTELSYFHSASYSPGHEGGVHHADPALAIDWPQAIASCSARDAELPLLKDVKPFQ